MKDDNDEKKNRTIRATDKEWNTLGKMAKAANISMAKLVLDHTVYRDNSTAKSEVDFTFPKEVATDIKSIKMGVRFLTKLEEERSKGVTDFDHETVLKLLAEAAELDVETIMDLVANHHRSQS
jgi:hypothetical protein